MTNKAYPSTAQSFAIVGIIFAAMLLLTPVNYLLNDPIGKGPSFLIYYVLSMGIPFAIIYHLKKRAEGVVRLQFVPKNGLALILIVITTLALQWGVSSPIANSIPMPESFKSMFEELALSMQNWYGFICVAIAAPLFEELIFRGVLLDGLLKRRSAWSAIIISSVLFGVVHLNPWQFVSALIIGLFAGWVYYRTRNLIYSIAIHFTNNFTAAIFLVFDEDNSSMSMELEELYGGTTNLYLIITGCIIVAVSTIYLLNKHLKSEAPEDENKLQTATQVS